MSRRGYPSTAHEYGANDQCIHCGMHKVNVEQMTHECKWWREKFADERDAKDAGVSVDDWKLGNDLDAHKEEKAKLQEKRDGGASSQTT